jgi:BNR/Asp-box repeat protein
MGLSLRRNRRFATMLVGGATLLVALVATGALAEDITQPIDFLHNVNQAPAPVNGVVWANGPKTPTGTAICTTPTQLTADVNTSCEGTGPNNETSIAVNPTNPNNILGGLNDYQLSLNPGGHVGETILSRAHVSFDGGKTWSMYPINSNSTYQATGDPSVAFDAHGRAYYATLGFRFVGPTNAQSPDVLVHTSPDGGKTWTQHVIAHGSGIFTSVGDVLDKEYLVAWGNGNALVTWDDFRQGQKGSFISVKIYDSVTHDGGATWSAPNLVSGNLTESFVPVPTVTADGRAFIAWLNTTDNVTGRDDYEVAEVSPTTGAALTAPIKVATTIDGVTDYPVALGRQTYQDSIFRSWAAGNITADPTNGAHLAVVWSDMRNSTLPAPTNPYAAVTNSDVIVSQSTDHGRHWSTPTALPLAGDQWMPWGAYDTSGRLRIGTFDRSGDPANHTYSYSLSTETAPGALTFGAPTDLSTVRSDPTKNNRWFAATLNANFPFATSFLGDYSNIAATASGGVVALWTDLRNNATFAGRTGHGEDAYYATAP